MDDEDKNMPAKSGNKVGGTRLTMTPERRDAFLAALRTNGGNVTAAAKVASPRSLSKSNPGYSSFRALMARDPGFALEVDGVMESVKADVYAEIYRRAMKGVREPIVQKGEQATLADGEPAWITRFDNRLLLRLAAKLDPNWSETKNIHHSVTHSAEVRLLPSDLAALSSDQQAQLIGILTTIKTARGEAPALEYADYEEVDDGGNTMAALDKLEE